MKKRSVGIQTAISLKITIGWNKLESIIQYKRYSDYTKPYQNDMNMISLFTICDKMLLWDRMVHAAFHFFKGRSPSENGSHFMVSEDIRIKMQRKSRANIQNELCEYQRIPRRLKLSLRKNVWYHTF